MSQIDKELLPFI